ncbi:FecR domain-containing protein [Flavobacteriaceae bacterium F89]|uniref:FecR domain-containing protein n=1 Tax=Cerina litoralis TaxID=2874477 RepID=A0AAE3EW96_9FLAO|nr:FecR domain-containing protein [Cerina litoralis]MCG2461680.1 FecR domain-containing protein [Cerina litoralis]
MKNTIFKLFAGTISKKELIELKKWLKDPKNQSVLEYYIKDYHDLNLVMLKNNVDEAYKKVMDKIESNENPVKRLIPNWVKYAAAVVLLFGLGFLYQQGFFTSRNDGLIVPKDDSITLELDNGFIQKIDVSQTKDVRDADGNLIGNQKQSSISYSPYQSSNELVYNTLNIPSGKQFELKLADGTVVHLNAGSSLRYPINFSQTSTRSVYLSGEAFFDVSKDKSRPFIVRVGDLDVKVLGTEFNVAAYKEDANIDVVLVKGSVSLAKTDTDKLEGGVTKLAPGQKGSFELATKDINVSQVNTALYTSWMQGHLVFRELSFDDILIKLERHYNIEIENTNEELGREVFNASFKNVGIEKVLSYFNDTHKIKYIIENNRVVIK